MGEGGAGDLRGSCLEGTQISKLFESDALRTSVDDDNEHAYLSKPFITCSLVFPREFIFLLRADS